MVSSISRTETSGDHNAPFAFSPRKSFKVTQLLAVLNEEIKGNYRTEENKQNSNNMFLTKNWNEKLSNLENKLHQKYAHLNNNAVITVDRTKKGKIMQAIQTFSYKNK